MDSWDLNIDFLAEPVVVKPSKKEEKKKEEKKRERLASTELSLKFLYRRAFSELNLFEALRDVELKEGTCVNVITGGNVDQMSYLSYFVRRWKVCDVAITTWCMSADDAFQLITWIQEGRIETCDIYVGEIFKSSYHPIWMQLKEFFTANPEKGRLGMFKCHAKIICGRTDDFDFSVQTSANMDTNPRTEQGCIQISKESYRFFKEYLDGIKSYE